VRRGLDTAAEEAKAALLQPVAERLYLRGAPTAAVLFGAFSPTVASEDVEAVTALMLSATAGSSSDANALEEVADWAEVAAEVDPHHAPWRQGYQLAEAFSDALRLSDEQPVDIEAVLDRLGVRVEELRLTDTTIRGLAILGPGHGPAMAVNRSFEDNERVEVRRFTLAHELAHLLFDRGFDRRVAVASGPWAPLDVEQRANAFAAYLLMPAALVNGVVARYEGVVASNEGVRAIAEQLGTSVTATAWHLANLGFIDRGRVGALIAAQLSS
jgi:Zn-dependent peptidase ImmA (M78 family)